MKKFWGKLKDSISAIRLVDRFLILFMLLLFLYTAIGLFTGMTDSQNDDKVDTIIRTSAASIFGYFISSNFAKTSTTADSYSRKPELPPQFPDEASEQLSRSKLQVTLVSAIGGCALVLLLITKFFIVDTTAISATVSQLRDFVSACIGFLVSDGRTK